MFRKRRNPSLSSSVPKAHNSSQYSILAERGVSCDVMTINGLSSASDPWMSTSERGVKWWGCFLWLFPPVANPCQWFALSSLAVYASSDCINGFVVRLELTDVYISLVCRAGLQVWSAQPVC